MQVVISVLKRFFIDRFHDQSAQMAYFFMLSIFPFLIFVISILSYLPIQATDLLTAIEQYAPERSYSLIRSNIESIFLYQRPKLASFSLVASFWISSLAVQSLVRAMNDVYSIKRKEGFWLALLKDLILTIVLVITLMISLLIPVGEEIGRIFIFSQFQPSAAFYYLWLFIKWGIGSVYLFIFFLFFYKFVPSNKIPIKSTIPGALFSTICWQSVSVGFSYYVTFASYSKLYGQLGNLIVLMIWFYLTAAVILTGGLINAAFMGDRA